MIEQGNAIRLGEAGKELLNLSGTSDIRIPTGYSIDDKCGRVGPGELALVWARSSAGKSTFALNLIKNTPQISTVFFSMEMWVGRLAEWLATMTFDLPVSAFGVEAVIRAGPDHELYNAVDMAIAELDLVYPSVYLTSMGRPTVNDLDDTVAAINAGNPRPIERVFIDHLELMAGTEDYSTLKQTTGDLHSWAINTGIAVFVLQQTGRGTGGQGKNDGHIPVGISDGVYSGEADADWIFGLWRPDRNPEFRKTRADFKLANQFADMEQRKRRAQGKAMLNVVKNRPFGELETDGIELRYEPRTRRLVELTEEFYAG